MSAMEKFEDEVELLRDISGVDSEKYPIRWLKWETQYKSPSGTRAPTWREEEGDLGYVIASTHDKGIVVIMCKNDGTCCLIKGYYVTESGAEELCYDQIGATQPDIKSALSEASEVFANLINDSLSERPTEDERDRKILDNELITLPQPVLVLAPPTSENDEGNDEENEAEDDDPIVPYPRAPPNDGEYWNINKKLKNFARNPADPINSDLHDLANNPNLKEAIGQRAVLDAAALPAMFDVLKIKQAQHTVEMHQSRLAEDVVQVLSQITTSPNIRRHIATEPNVKILLGILKKEERPLMEGLFTTIANCCHNTKFRELLVKNEGVEPLIYQIKKPEFASQVCYLLWILNRSEHSTQVMLKSHLDHELQQKYITQPPEKLGDQLMLNIIRLYYSVAKYDANTANSLYRELILFFCSGLVANSPDLVAMSARTFTIFKISDELQKIFCSQQCQGPVRLVKTLESKVDDVILAGLESISVVGNITKIRNDIVDASAGNILPKLQALWKHENPEIRKGVLCALGVLTQTQKCAQWTVRQNLIPDLIEYLHSTDYDFVIYSAKAIGACCTEKENLSRLMQLNGVRILWSLMKSPSSGVQAAATRALVPFLQSETAPSVVRTFVDGLDLVVNLLKSNDSDVQASACMAISEIAKDQENLAVMTDLGLVELLSRLLSTKLDDVRKPLADAIGVSANWSNNRRRFGEEGAVGPLVSYLRPPSNNKEVHAATAKALKALSEDQENSNNLRRAGVVEYLLKMVESKDPNLQMAAAVAIRNIRTNCVHSNDNSSQTQTVPQY
ncbi:Armadillo/beta-catenin-like repeat family protein [Tritrichomonas foetus]|uniref:Armadillo/beta-catenin-like repeat family protein n=1 Tax=Tritrichomonas foetus TaxID=1144522 RepID=A0A1J4J9K1_9EUKA|nr:Armadillo/beta-catenin-like repeat family protein [Tritrichomonas foetus]|eukprot:OHS94331.1 Armadillo/beta-catenin-like repeat family protein [Tritrichomonas foetus]